MSKYSLFIASILICGNVTLPAFGQRVSIDAALRNTEKPYIQAFGTGTVLATPDQAVVNVGVVTQESTAAEAAAQCARQTDLVLNQLRKMLGAGSRLRTIGYSVRPDYQLPKPGSAPGIRGYTATNTVEITLNDLSLVGKILDSASKTGANSISNLQYELKDPSEWRARALKDAAAKAKASAEAIAAGLGLKISKIISAEEYFGDDSGGMYKKAAPPSPARAVTETPLEVGMVEITTVVMLRAELTQ
ncbi:MAG: SIMPL domain-containing protein [Paludibaculum sp.]